MYAVDFDGANVQKLTDEQSVILSPDWSPNGRFIVYTSYKEHNPDLVLLDPDGRRRRRPLLRLPGINSAPPGLLTAVKYLWCSAKTAIPKSMS